MYQSQNYYQSLGTAGHRATSSYNYMPQYTPGDYYNAPQSQHGHSRSFYSNYQPCGVPQAPQQQFMAPPQMGAVPPLQAPAPAPIAQDQPSNGGINSVLEYDLNSMSTFISWCTYGMLKQDKSPSKEFENLVVSVLFATRLPKSTIIIALEYMNQRFSNKNFGDLKEQEIFTRLIVSLVLGNKFNDDNTFTNRSWCGATGLQIEVINKEEKEWLSEINWQLNVVNFESNIRTMEECWKTWLEKYSTNSNYNSPTVPQNYSPYTPNTYQSSSIPSSPNYHEPSYSYGYTSPTASSPTKYSHDSIWANTSSTKQNNNIWSYTPTYQYVPNNSMFPDPVNNYFGSSNFVGYANPYYNYNMASC